MSALTNALEGRAEKYSSNNYLYGRALELAGQSVVSLYTNAPCPLGVGLSRRLPGRIAVASIVTVAFTGFAIAASAMITQNNQNTAGFPGPSGPSHALLIPFILIPALAIIGTWVAVLRGSGDKKIGQAMIARGQQLSASAPKVDETAMRADMESIWAEATRIAAMNARTAALRNNRLMMQNNIMSNQMINNQMTNDPDMGNNFPGSGF